MTGTPWLPANFDHPLRVELPTGDHLRPIRETDVDIDYPAVMGSRDRLWTIFGLPWGWPRATMTFAEDQRDLARHEREQNAHESFNYAILDESESRLFGCIYIDPPQKLGSDADISWWVVDEAVGSTLDNTIAEFVPRWVAQDWPFTQPRFLERDLTWAQWLALPDRES
jgi:RimJ/RimL family protein N-acetyltransferase